jgi:uncharacterized membrane protein
MTRSDRLKNLALVGAGALVALMLAWELWLAPAREGGSMLALKALPLAIALPAFARGNVRAYQWWSMLVLVYLCEGVVRGMTDVTSAGRALGWAEVALSTLTWGAIIAYVMAARAADKP